jgi:hypothetical protein
LSTKVAAATRQKKRQGLKEEKKRLAQERKKIAQDEEKSDFAFLSFFVLYYINKALCENLMAISKVLFEIWPFYISASFILVSNLTLGSKVKVTGKK